MASRAIWSTTSPLTGFDKILDAGATKFVSAAGPHCLFGRFITDVADQDILTAFCMPFEQQIGMICDLAHLHDQTEDIGVIVEHDTTRDIGIKLASCVRHDARGEITFDFPEEFVM